VLTSSQVSTHAGVYAVLPVGQKRLFEYSTVPHAETEVTYGKKQYPAAAVGCLGTAYTMLARLVGSIYSGAQVRPNSSNLCQLSTESAATAHVDCLLDANGNGFWPTSLNSYAKLSDWVVLDDSAVEQDVEQGSPVVLHGIITNYVNGKPIGLPFDHFIIATSVVASGTSISRLVVNDPELGMQVFIDMNSGDGGTYRHAVFNPTGSGDLPNFQQLTGFDLEIDEQFDKKGNLVPGTYRSLNWQDHG
jgi:hypothetical protein